MELYKSVLIKELEGSDTKISGIEKIIENRCYEALEKIIKIIKTPELNDEDCFVRIEKIIVELENLGADGGFRHDFG